MALSPQQPQREITTAERQRMTRTFLWIIVGFFAAVGVMVAYLSAGGRAVRDYGQAVLEAAKARPSQDNVSYEVPCAQVLRRDLPAGAESCVVKVDHGKPTVLIKMEGNREYRIDP